MCCHISTPHSSPPCRCPRGGAGALCGPGRVQQQWRRRQHRCGRRRAHFGGRYNPGERLARPAPDFSGWRRRRAHDLDLDAEPARPVLLLELQRAVFVHIWTAAWPRARAGRRGARARARRRARAPRTRTRTRTWREVRRRRRRRRRLRARAHTARGRARTAAARAPRASTPTVLFLFV